MARQDFYEVLGVERGTSKVDLKKAYRRSATKCHPNRNPGDKGAEDEFKEANEICEVLSDASKRVAYDQYGHVGVDPNMGGGVGAGSGRVSFSDIFGDMFGDFFGGDDARGGSCGGAQRGANLRYAPDLDLEETVRGITATIRAPTLVGCKTCNGSGAKPGATPVICITCDGIGQVHAQQGSFSVQQVCPRCHGASKMISDPCGSCHSQECVEEQKTLSMRVPVGADIGDRIRLTGEGEAGSMDGPAGDLCVAVNVYEHPILQRDGKHPYCEVPVSFADAALDGELEVSTLDGRVRLKISENTQTGRPFRLRDKGVVPVRGGGAGDLICKMVVETSANLDKRQREPLEEFRRPLQSNASHLPKANGWLEGTKRFFDDL